MARPKLPPDARMENVSARVPRKMADAIDDYLKELEAETPLLILNRADAIRQLLALGLEKVGRYELKSKGRKPKRGG